jgi:5-methylcytosine-specific restriction enzyme subunit McrC
LKIPIQNIYYLLCYAWDKLDEGNKVDVSKDDYESSLELLCRVFISGCKYLFKKGIEQSYVDVQEEYSGVKGKLDFKQSLKRNLFDHGKAICEFDDLNTNNLSNQLLKATIRILSRTNNLDKKIKEDLHHCYSKFQAVSNIELQIRLFNKVNIHRNNSFYKFLLAISKLIFENSTLDESTGNYKFSEFISSDMSMAGLFEAFIRNFYKRELKNCLVSRTNIKWDATPLEDSSINFLPLMQTDITIQSDDITVIIDAKYYKEALNNRFNTLKFHSSNIYQLYSYVRNLEVQEVRPLDSNIVGMLIYPTVGYHVKESYKIANHRIIIRTLDLNQNWRQIHNELLGFISNL